MKLARNTLTYICSGKC